MFEDVKSLIDKLASTHSLSLTEWTAAVKGFSPDTARYAAQIALKERERIYGKDVYIRGLIEISNYCKNNCLYCGIRRDNKNCDRYRLSRDEILACCREGYALGFRTFVLQGGEDPYYTDDVLCGIIADIKSEFSDCAVTLSLGERTRESYERLYKAGADRYLLRHETADESHYNRLHPADMSYKARILCLKNLREIGFQVGCGMMVGSPYQAAENLAKDLKFIEEFSPDMCGIGPFIPHANTPFGTFLAGSGELTCYLLSLIRILKPNILLPATTALATVDDSGREKGLLAGANVVMPNLSPVSVRAKYSLYNNKVCTGEEAAECVRCLCRRVESVGFNIVESRGDIKTYKE
ncbi:MAG: [FeFe] hydrogenase H-cluster radical SAM maturase HydE [Clostridia bacterium]|nr:[FeFe] hydrogenase H-cluster radical SAM maturase HydE [Clostridia bacterium]